MMIQRQAKASVQEEAHVAPEGEAQVYVGVPGYKYRRWRNTQE